MSDTKIKPFSSNLRVKLTDREVNERVERYADRMGQIEQLREDFKSTKEHYKAQVDAKEAEAKQLLTEMRDRAVLRDVECQEVFHYRLGIVQQIRLDTREVINERAMTDRERQLELPEVADEYREDEEGTEASDGPTNWTPDETEDPDTVTDFEQLAPADEPEGEPEPEAEPEPVLATVKRRRARNGAAR